MEIFYITLLVLVASFLGTITGFGISTIMIPVVLIFFPLPQALLFVGIIHLFGDVWKIVLFRKGINWRLILAFGMPGAILSYLGARLALGAPEKILSQILGAMLITYVVFVFVKPGFKLKKKNTYAVAGGALYGFIAGTFGIGGVIRSAFLSAYDLKKAVYLTTTGVIALFVDSTRLVTYFTGGIRLEPLLLWGMIAFIPMTFIGAEAAKKILFKIPQKYFRYFIAVFLLAFGIRLILFP